jgi:hypothetical protein
MATTARERKRCMENSLLRSSIGSTWDKQGCPFFLATHTSGHPLKELPSAGGTNAKKFFGFETK